MDGNRGWYRALGGEEGREPRVERERVRSSATGRGVEVLEGESVEVLGGESVGGGRTGRVVGERTGWSVDGGKTMFFIENIFFFFWESCLLRCYRYHGYGVM